MVKDDIMGKLMAPEPERTFPTILESERSQVIRNHDAGKWRLLSVPNYWLSGCIETA